MDAGGKQTVDGLMRALGTFSKSVRYEPSDHLLAALAELASDANLDFSYLDAALLSRPELFNALLRVADTEAVDSFFEARVSPEMCSDVDDWYFDCMQELTEYFLSTGELTQTDRRSDLPPLGATFRRASAADGRGPNAFIGDFFYIGFPVMKEALRLVINGMCYLTAYHEDTDSQWPADAPPRLLDKVHSTVPKEAQRARSQLESLGYRPVHLCGAHWRRSAAGAGGSTGTAGHKGWRRGHWLRQAYGTGWSLRKLQWRMPVLVGRDLPPDEDDPPGHLYLVS